MAPQWCLFPADCSRENPHLPISSWQPFNNPIKQKWKGNWSQRGPKGKRNSVCPFTLCSWNNSHCRDANGTEGPKPPRRATAVARPGQCGTGGAKRAQEPGFPKQDTFPGISHWGSGAVREGMLQTLRHWVCAWEIHPTTSPERCGITDFPAFGFELLQP